ncbi:hypothetical protein JNB_19013 [Janibacter sp. HTCC2649]|uniref:hypothetical protein n=1 Tax=Janibacter sp. HTCC2649 TaxID=313589 RepID=UPI0000670ED2|nr:hypothetical protein [Janibacter sp. HTCC2649]EAP97591.1 hypothetical protein JNB_19013 [Janibacter sp. HTCC2649]
MRSQVPGDPGSVTAAGTAARRAARELAAASEGGTTAYAALKDSWGTSTSVRLRKEGQRSIAALTESGRQADVVGAALQTYAAELSELQARARRVVDAADTAGLVIEHGQVGLGWGVTGEADLDAARDTAALVSTLQTELDGLTAQHRRRRDRLLAEVLTSTRELAEVAGNLRLR